ncbi:MAG: efflux RND transporter periplasmic adaptor subunit [Proteobacteria bacterium]|nr:efflux RND transporter periplasmic adaptor subunit [Pseudomonadota bacterium]
MRKILFLSIVVLAGLGIWAYSARSSSEQAETGQRYRSEKIGRGPIIATVAATGTVMPTTTVIVGSQLSGQVVEILADFNSEVKAGQILARLNRDTLTARRDGALADLAQARAARQLSDAQSEKVRADIRRAEAQQGDMQAQAQRAEALLADAETTFERQNSLKARGIATDVALQSAATQRATQVAAKRSAEAQIASSRAQIASLQADLKVVEAQKLSGDAQVAKAEAIVRQIEVDMANSEIKSPVDGVVVQRNIELGQTVAASLQSPTLFLVAQNLRQIEIYVNVDEADVGRVKVGQEVEFSVNAYMARNFRGQVKQIRLGSQNVQNVVIYTTVVSVPNEDMALLPGMTANLRIFTERKPDVLRVPNAALRWQPAGAPRPAGGEGGENAVAATPTDETPFAAQREGNAGGNAGAQMLANLKTELKLSEQQLGEVEKLLRVMREAIAAAGNDPAARREAVRTARQRFGRAVEALLDAEQKVKYRALIENRRQNPQAGPAQRTAQTGVPGRVYLLGEDGSPRLVNLRLGANDGAYSEILGAEVKPGDTVITGAIAPAKGRAGSTFRFGF